MEYDVVVIGAGQAGLAMGYYLKKSPLKVLILDKNQRVGEVWRKRYDSLVLFTPRAYSALPGLALEGDQTGYPNKDEIVDYLERYSQKFDLPIQFNSDVKKVYKEGNMFNIQVNESLIQTKQVVVATGPLHTPRIPSFSQVLPKDIFQLHTSEYKNPSQLIDGAVLVVGGGNSGTQIAAELSNDRETFLSIGQSLRFLPLKIVSKSIFWWFDKLGILKANRYTFLGKKLKNQGDPIFGFELKQKIKSGRVQLKGRTTQVQQNKIIFEDQSFLRVNNVFGLQVLFLTIRG